MKPQYEDARRKILERAAWLEKRIGLNWIEVTHTFVEGFKSDDDSDTIADTQTYWQYRQAVTRWFLPAVVRLTDDDLTRDVRHEYIHIVLSPMESHVPSKFEEQCEFAVESMSIVLGNALTEKLTRLE